MQVIAQVGIRDRVSYEQSLLGAERSIQIVDDSRNRLSGCWISFFVELL